MAMTLVGIFDEAEQARRASAELTSAGIEERMIRTTASNMGGTETGTGSGQSSSGEHRGFFAKLFGMGQDDEQSGHYAEAVRRGSYVVTVHLDDDSHADRVNEILEAAGAIDVDQRVEAWKAGGYQGHDASAPAYSQDESAQDRQTLKVMQEELQVGKRTVEGGGVRVRRFTTEQPVSEEVSLHEERVIVDRRPVDRQATPAEIEALGKADKDIELREMSEQAVVSKTARVVEEVDIGKQATDRNETIQDTVRRTDVDVERIDPAAGQSRSDQAEAPRQPQR